MGLPTIDSLKTPFLRALTAASEESQQLLVEYSIITSVNLKSEPGGFLVSTPQPPVRTVA